MKRTALRLFALLLPLLVLPALSAFADGGGRPLMTTLTGAAEIPGPGDPDGFGVASLSLRNGRSEICYDISVMEVTLPATSAHIHEIDPELGFGPIVVALSAPGESGHSTGCATVRREVIKAILQNPEGYYVNVHTTDYPDGALRGDLSK